MITKKVRACDLKVGDRFFYKGAIHGVASIKHGRLYHGPISYGRIFEKEDISAKSQEWLLLIVSDGKEEA